MTSSTISDETLAEYAELALRRPENYLRLNDYGQYETHAPTFRHVPNADDLVGESNYEAFIEILNGIDAQDDFEVLGEKDWAFGQTWVVYVRVRDDDGQFTAAWREAVRCLLYIRDDYPILDESDLSEREWKAFEDAYDETYDRLAREYDDLDDEDFEDFAASIRLAVDDQYCNEASEWRADAIDEPLLRRAITQARSNLYTARGEAFMLAEADALREQHTGQLPPIATDREDNQ